jgi:hypothetical protein
MILARVAAVASTSTVTSIQLRPRPRSTFSGNAYMNLSPRRGACHKPRPPCETALPQPGSSGETKEVRPRLTTAVP